MTRCGSVKREEAEAKLKAADQRANSTVEVDYAQAEFAVASNEEASANKLHVRGDISSSEYQKLALEKRRAELQIEKSQNDLLIEKLNADAERSGSRIDQRFHSTAPGDITLGRQHIGNLQAGR